MYPAALNVNDARKALKHKGLSGHRAYRGSAALIVSGGKFQEDRRSFIEFHSNEKVLESGVLSDFLNEYLPAYFLDILLHHQKVYQRFLSSQKIH